MIRAIKAVIIKELRENLLWAMLVCVMGTGVLVAGIYGGLDSGLPLVQKSLLGLCMMMYPLAGLSLGWLQVYQDSRRGRWQFVTHRPMSRSLLFACKIAAGFFLYLSATVLPLGVIFISVSIPGYVPGPVNFDMILPALAYVAAGLMWYAAGLLIASRQARWFGSRLMPVAVPVLGMILFTAFAITFGEAVLTMLPSVALLLVAAWGSFIAAEGSACSPVVSKLCTGISVGVGWVMGIVTVMVIIGGLIDPLVIHRQESSTYYKLDQHGELQIVHGSYAAGKDTLSGTTILLADEQLASRSSRVHSAGFLVADSHARPFDSSSREKWYCVPSHGTVDGYDTRTGRYIGSIGEDGFAPPGGVAKPFDHMQPSALNENNGLFSAIITRNAVFSLNVPDRQVRKLFSSPADDPVLGVGMLPPVGRQNSINTDDRVVVTRSHIHFIRDFKTIASISREKSLNQYYITVGRTDDGSYVAASLGGPVGWNPVDVFVYDRDGKLMHQTNLPAGPQHYNRVSERWWYMAGLLIPNPPAFFATVFAVRWWDGERQVWMPLGELVGVLAVYLAIGFAMLRARHASRGRMILWLVMIGCLGLGGILLLLSMWETPGSVQCAKCSRRRLVTEQRCPRCCAEAESPAMKGIEIFESDVAVAM
jgi:hypothetical protein